MAACAWRHCMPHAFLLALPHAHAPLAAFNTCFALTLRQTCAVHNMPTFSEAVGHFWWACQQDNEICLLKAAGAASLLPPHPAVAKQICKYGCSNATQSQPATHNQAQHTAVGTGINSIVPRCCCCSDCAVVVVAAVLVGVISHIALHL